MSTTDDLPVREYPTSDLAHHYDDDGDPSEITLFDPDAEDVTTAWLTAAAEDAVSLADAR